MAGIFPRPDLAAQGPEGVVCGDIEEVVDIFLHAHDLLGDVAAQEIVVQQELNRPDSSWYAMEWYHGG